MGEVIRFRSNIDTSLNKKWDQISKLLDDPSKAVAIKIAEDGTIEIHHSPDIDQYTLIGLLEVVKNQLLNTDSGTD